MHLVHNHPMAQEHTPDDLPYKQVQGLSRGIAVLRTLCASLHGRALVSDISAATGLHRTTVRRLLETLQLEGFVERSTEGGAFQLTPTIRQLGASYSVYDEVADAALPILRRLSDEITWPCSIATPEADVMVIRAATHDVSPLSFHRSVIGRRLPMLITSMGRAYMAFASAETRERMLDLMEQSYKAGEVPLLSLSTFRQILQRTVSDGYGSNYGEWKEDQKVSAIAVPVRRSGKEVIACINIVSITRALKPQQLATRFLEALQRAAAEIEAAV